MPISHRFAAAGLPITILCVNSFVALSVTSVPAAPQVKSARTKPAPLIKSGAAAKAKDEVEIVNPLLPKGFPNPDVAGTVMIPDDKPAVGARVMWITGEANDKNPLIATTDDQGRFHFDGKSAWGKKLASGTVMVQAEGYAMTGGRVDFAADMMHPPPIAVTLAPASEAHVKLIDPQGKPAAGVALRIRSYYKDRDLVSIPEGQTGSQRVLSVADGSVTLPGLPQGWTAVISVDDPKFSQLRDPFNQLTVASAAITEWEPIKLTLGASLEGIVATPDGKPVSNAGVQARCMTGDGDNQVFGQTDERGHFILTQALPGEYKLSVNLDRTLGGQFASRELSCSVKPGEHKTGLKMALVKGAIVTGHVSYRGSNKPASGVWITISRANAGTINNWASVSTDASGNYRLCAIGGPLSVSTQVPGVHNIPENVSVRDGETRTLNLMVDTPIPPVLAHGIVIGEDGKPVAGADISCSTADYDQPSTHSGPDGKFTIHVSNSPLMYLRARKGDSVSVADVTALDGDDVTLRLRNNALSTISGKVVDIDGKPVAAASVTTTQWHSRAGYGQGSVTTDPSGGYTIAKLMPGYRYSIRVSARGFGDGNADQLLPKPGETLPAANITLIRADSFVAGRVIDSHGFPLANARVTLDVSDQISVSTDKQGKFRIEGVAPGDVVIQVKAGDEWMSSRVTAGKDNIIRTESLAAQQREEEARPKPVDYAGKYAPEISVSNWVNVSPVTMSDLKGKIVIFDMWGCCVDSLVETQQLAHQFAARGVVAIGLNVSGASLRDVQEHVAQEKLTLPIAIDKDTAKAFGSDGFEYYALVGRDGKITYTGQDFHQLMTSMARLLSNERKGAK